MPFQLYSLYKLVECQILSLVLWNSRTQVGFWVELVGESKDLKLRDHWSGGYLCVWLHLFGHMSQLKSHISIISALYILVLCLKAFKFSRINVYINVHIEFDFQSKKMCTSKAMVCFLLSLPK